MAMLLKLAQEYSEDLSNESKHAVTRNHKPAAIGVLYIPGKLYQKDRVGQEPRHKLRLQSRRFR